MKYDLSTASFYLPKGLKQNGSESGCRCEEVREDDCQTIEDRQCKWPARLSTFFSFLLFSCFYTFTLSHFLDCFSSLLQQGNREGAMCGKAREKVQESEGGSQY